MDIGSRITQLRKAKGISTNKLANLAGVSQSYLREVEMGKKNPTVETLSYLIFALGLIQPLRRFLVAIKKTFCRRYCRQLKTFPTPNS